MRRDLVGDVALYLITDAAPRAQPFDAFLAEVIDAGVGMVQLRDRALSDRQLLDAARVFARTCRDNGALFIVNDRVDIALLSGADGVHLGQDDAHPDDVRTLAGNDFIVGLSSHSAEQIAAANETSADYVGVGPIYETPTKPGRSAVGLELVRFAAREARKPFFAIGGIDLTNCEAVVAAGARSLSVVRAVTRAENPAASVRELLGAVTSRR